MKRFSLGLTALFLMLSFCSTAQTNVFDDIIVPSPNHTYLEAAILQEGLEGALQNSSATLTVFAPTDAAFDSLAAALNTNIAGLLALPNLTDILTYHVLGTTVPSSAVTNGAIVQPLSTTNTLKLTLTSMGMVYVNQAQVTTADVSADNGVVHVLNKIVLPVETVADVAIDNGFTTLTTAVVTAELLPALTDPLAELTVFAPTNQAFDSLAAALNTDINGLLALPNLADILTYHVLGTEVPSSAVTNGAIVQPLSTTNTLKLTLTSMGMVYVNQAQVTTADVSADNGVVHILDAVVLPSETVVDIALDNGFTSLATAVVTAELLPALTDPLAELTVFAPTNQAFDDLAMALNTDINGLLALPNLADILTYHVLGTEVPSSAVTNGAIAQPLSTTNTLKLTLTSMGMVYVNQAQVTTADVGADNGVVHVLDAVVLPSETVVDIALDNGFTSLATAVVTAELLPALTNPLAELTVFAPTNQAFDDLAAALNTDINGLLALPNLADILTYHVLGTEVPSSGVTNGAIVQPLSATNTLKLTVTTNGEVYVNQAEVTSVDISSDNGIVHVLNAVVLPSETVVDIAIDNGFTSLTAAVIKAELLPALTNPLVKYTVFAPTNQAFDDLAADLGTDLDGVLASPDLQDILLYHVANGENLSSSLTDGMMIPTLYGQSLEVSISGSAVMINSSNVASADVLSDNGVVHVVDAVLTPSANSVKEVGQNNYKVYPNPATDIINIESLQNNSFEQATIYDMSGRVILQTTTTNNNSIDVSAIEKGSYILGLATTDSVSMQKIQIL